MADRTPDDLLVGYRLRIRVQAKPPEYRGRSLYPAHKQYAGWFKLRVKAKRMARHPDGSVCLEGMRSPLPKDYQPCCAQFEDHLWACIYEIRYEWWPRSRVWIIRVADGGSSGIVINFCPHCGTPLPTIAPKHRLGRIIEI
jgi:hypothetical protein